MNNLGNVDLSVIAAKCIIFAQEQGMTIQCLNSSAFMAQGNGMILDIPMEFLTEMIKKGWTIDEVLQNEACYDEETA